MSNNSVSYAEAILEGFRYLLANHPKTFVIGQGLWSPWYVGASMTDLDIEFGKERVIDCPVSELATTGAALGAALCDYRPIVVHPRMDFMVLAIDQIVNQAAKWSHMFGGQVSAPVTIRSIINRGGEQGAQHSQSLHSWFAHVPGLRVVMPASVADARDLLIASVLSDDPVLYIDDRWLYDNTAELNKPIECNIADVKPQIVRTGNDCTLVGSGYAVHQMLQAAAKAEESGISCEVIDLRVINPIDYDISTTSVKKTGRLCAVDGGWTNCGLAGEVVAGVVERLSPKELKSAPIRRTLCDAPAPTSKPLEAAYYTDVGQIVQDIKTLCST